MGRATKKGGFAWLKRAAEGGNVAAQNRLAKLYMQGIGTEPDAIFAAAWYILAHRAGLADPMMDDFMNGLTDDEVRPRQRPAPTSSLSSPLHRLPLLPHKAFCDHGGADARSGLRPQIWS